MSNKHRGEVTLKLAKTKLTLRPTFEAVVEVEERTGMSMLRFLQKAVIADVRTRDAAILIHQTAKAADPDAPSYVEIGALLVKNGLNAAVFDSISDLLSLAIGGETALDEGSPDEVPTDPAPTPA